MQKLTKTQKEFFTEFSRQSVSEVLVPVLAQHEQLSEVPYDLIRSMVETLDLSELSDAVGKEFLARVDFKTLKKVDTFVRSDDFQKVALAGAEVNYAVHELLIGVIRPLIEQLDSETASE